MFSVRVYSEAHAKLSRMAKDYKTYSPKQKLVAWLYFQRTKEYLATAPRNHHLIDLLRRLDRAGDELYQLLLEHYSDDLDVSAFCHAQPGATPRHDGQRPPQAQATA